MKLFASTALVAATATFSALATPLSSSQQHSKRCSPFEVFPYFNAADKNITYYPAGAWTMVTNQTSTSTNVDMDGVEAYSNSSCAYWTLKSPLGAGTFNIYAGKKADRGYFDVYIGDQLLGTGDAYNASCTSNCTSTTIFAGDLGLPGDAGSANATNYLNQTITVRNRANDTRVGKTPYIDLNYVIFTPGNC